MHCVPHGVPAQHDKVDRACPAEAASTATFAPKGTSGGMVTVLAGLNGKVVKRQIFIKLTGEQNGPDLSNPAEQAQIPATVPELNTGGGVSGVGGEGLGVPVPDMATLGALENPSGDGQAEGPPIRCEAP
jgi:hypothetical protein